MDSGLYDKARSAKIAELKKLMQELMSDDGNEEMGKDELDSAMDEAGQTAAEETDQHAAAPDDVAEEDPAPEEDPLTKAKREYFRPSAKPPRAGTAFAIAATKKMPPKRRGIA